MNHHEKVVQGPKILGTQKDNSAEEENKLKDTEAGPKINH